MRMLILEYFYEEALCCAETKIHQQKTNEFI